MDLSKSTLFRKAALASGLVTSEQLNCALVAASEFSDGTTIALKDVPDHRLEKLLIEQGSLNHWQVEQLREGRTKFTLGPYRIIDSIGRGGMGHVFKGEHCILGRVEAVKVLPKEKTTPEAIEGFHREIRSQAQLDHPNLVRVSFAGQDGDTHFFVTEYVEGTDLRKLVRQFGRLTMQQAATIISQAADGLEHAHQSGLIHRDVKPGNILVTPDGRSKVTDLGLSVLLDENIDKHSKIAGTVDYLAPELIRDSSLTGPANDIYSLGCTMYYAVTGKVPYPGGSTSEKLRRHLEQPPITPRRFNPELSDMFLEILAQMMEKNPAMRIQSAADVMTHLRPWTLQAVRLGDGAEVREENESTPSSIISQVSQRTGFEDTEANLDEAAEEAQRSTSSAQSSQGTLRISAWREETTPINDDESEPSTPREPIMSAWLMAMIVAAAGVLTGVIGLIIYQQSGG